MIATQSLLLSSPTAYAVTGSMRHSSHRPPAIGPTRLGGSYPPSRPSTFAMRLQLLGNIEFRYADERVSRAVRAAIRRRWLSLELIEPRGGSGTFPDVRPADATRSRGEKR